MSSGDNGPVLAAQFSDAATACIAAGMLEDNGITAVVSSSNMNTLYGAGPTWAPVELYVHAADFGRARKLLGEHGDI